MPVIRRLDSDGVGGVHPPAVSSPRFWKRDVHAWVVATALCTWGSSAAAQREPPANEDVLGPFVVTGTAQEHVTTLAVLPSLSFDLEDVIVRGVVRRDLELSGMFKIIPDKKAPAGTYGFDDPVDVGAWQSIGAEVIVKVAARKRPRGKVDVLGLAYFLNVGKDPVYQKKLTVTEPEVRVTAHRITDALLGAITGRPGGFASRFTYSARWGKHRRIMTMDADGHGLKPVTPADVTAISPTWGPNLSLFYTQSTNYAPFKLLRRVGSVVSKVPLIFTKSVLLRLSFIASREEFLGTSDDHSAFWLLPLGRTVDELLPRIDPLRPGSGGQSRAWWGTDAPLGHNRGDEAATRQRGDRQGRPGLRA